MNPLVRFHHGLIGRSIESLLANPSTVVTWSCLVLTQASTEIVVGFPPFRIRGVVVLHQRTWRSDAIEY